MAATFIKSSSKFLLLFPILFHSIVISAQQEPIDYLELGIKAMNNNDLPRADSLLSLGSQVNPHKGEIWFQLARTYYQMGNYNQAVTAYLKTDSLGYGKKWVALGLAYSYWSLGDKPNAIRWFEALVRIDPSWMDQIRGDNLRLFIGEDDYERIVGKKADAHATRDEKWRHDLALLRSALHRSHYDVHVSSTAQEWDALYDHIYDAIPDNTDKEIALEFAQYTALAGDGHTNIWPQFYEYDFKMLPVLIYPFSDGFYIRASDQHYPGIAGSKVLKIGDMEIQEVYKNVSGFVGHDNSMHELLVFPAVVSTVEVLEMIGAIDSSDSISLTLLKDGAVIEEIVKAIPWDYDLIGRCREASQWEQMSDDTINPLYLSQLNNYYWSTVIPEHQLMYLQINQIRNKEEEPFADFIESSFRLIDSLSIQHLVIDIRLNDGGDTEIYQPLIRALIKSPLNKKGQLFTIIGRMTYSAAMNLAVDLEYWTETIFVGEPTGSSPVFIGENKAFFLPNSGLRVSISDRQHQRGAGSSTDKRTWIAPDYYTPLSAEQFKNGVNPAMKLIDDLLGGG